MKVNKIKLSALSLLVMGGLTGWAQAGTWTLGGSVLMAPSLYLGDDDKIYPVPLVNYEGEDFYFRTLSVGYYLWKDPKNQLSLNAFYLPLSFKPSDSDDAKMKLLDKRHSGVMGGASFTHRDSWGHVRLSLSGDLINNSNGFVGDMAYLYPIQVGTWTFNPGIGLSWNSGNFNDYYYGVNDIESKRSKIEGYSAGSSWNPYVELSTNYQISQQWNAFFTAKYIHLASEVKDSPIVDKSYDGLLWTGVTYTF